MGNHTKPTLGYPSRTAAVLALKAEGLTTHAIADRVGIGIGAVSGLVSSAARQERRRVGGVQPAAPLRPVADVTLNYDLMREMRPHAAKRNLKVNALALEIVEAVVERGLVDMVLAGREI